MNNVLILSAGRRVELALAFSAELKARKLDARVFATDMKPEISAACHVVDKWFRAPRDPSYIDFLLDTCREQSVSLVIPTIDTELLVLSSHREAFALEGAHISVSDEDLVRQCRDKRLTAELFKRLGIDTPQLFNRDALRFPCFVKPVDGSCSIGAARIDSSHMMSEAVLADENMMFMEFIDSTHVEYTVDAYFDRHGDMRCLVPRERLETRAGEVSKGVTRQNHVYDYLKTRLARLEGARGCITLQLFSNAESGRFAALEINPRFGGGYPLSYSAGANYPGWLIDEYVLQRDIPFFDGWENNLLMLRYDAKVLVHGFGH